MLSVTQSARRSVRCPRHTKRRQAALSASPARIEPGKPAVPNTTPQCRGEDPTTTFPPRHTLQTVSLHTLQTVSLHTLQIVSLHTLQTVCLHTLQTVSLHTMQIVSLHTLQTVSPRPL